MKENPNIEIRNPKQNSNDGTGIFQNSRAPASGCIVEAIQGQGKSEYRNPKS
jgi:hypothetical protein